MPPSTAIEAITSRSVIASLNSSTPPNAVTTGTLSCTIAAVVDFRCRTAEYQIT